MPVVEYILERVLLKIVNITCLSTYIFLFIQVKSEARLFGDSVMTVRPTIQFYVRQHVLYKAITAVATPSGIPRTRDLTWHYMDNV